MNFKKLFPLRPARAEELPNLSVKTHKHRFAISQLLITHYSLLSVIIMPELPEVETVVRRLRKPLIGQRIVRAQVSWARTIEAPSAATFCRHVRGAEFVAIERRGKYLLFELSSGETMLAHLRMTGDFVVCEADAERDRYMRVRWVLANGVELRYTDTRKFGRIVLTAQPDEWLGHLGPEPLSPSFTPKALAKILEGRATPIKPLLLNQERIAGLGNIYADEALHYARIHPQRAAHTLRVNEVKQLHQGIRAVLRKGIRLGGSTLYDHRFFDPFGKPGRMQNEFVVYHDPRREEKCCPRCGARIAHQIIAQRTAHFCPRCQR